MPTDAEYEASLRAAETALKQAASAEEVRSVWKTHVGALGHRTLGRLLMGQSGDRLLDRRAERSE